MLSAIPDWLVFVLGMVAGALVVLAIGPASDTYWEMVYRVRRAALIVGAVVLAGLAGAALVGIGYLIIQSQSS